MSPLISSFYGIKITMYFDDHNPPHFHAEYGEYRGLIQVENLASKGNLPPKALAIVIERASQHKAELMDNWEACKYGSGEIFEITPLE